MPGIKIFSYEDLFEGAVKDNSSSLNVSDTELAEENLGSTNQP